MPLSSRRVFKSKAGGEGQFDVGAYTDVITAFYEKHPVCRNFPFPFLLQNLGSEYSKADELYEKAVNGRLKGYEIRSPEWCSGDNPDTAKP